MRQPLLRVIAYEKIKRKILHGDLKSGETVTENELVLALNMSRTPIRDAIQKLEHEGFLKVFSKQGIVIQELSLKNTNDLFDLRMAIETYALSKIIQIISEQQIIELEELITKQRRACDRSDPTQFMMEDAKFHQHLILITENELYKQYICNIKDRLFYHGLRIITNNDARLKEALEEHVQILQAIKSKDVDTAKKCMELHLLNGKKTLLSLE